MHLEHKPSDEVDVLISAVNEADLGWKADVCKYQKHHANYGAHCDLQLAQEAISLAQTSTKSKDSDLVEEAADEGEDQKPEFGVEGDKAFEAALTKAQLSMKKFLSFQKNRVLYFTWDRDGTWSAPMFNIRSTIDPDVCDDGYQCNQHDNSAVGMVYAKERLSILRKAEIRKFGDDDIQCTKYKKVGTSCQVICGDDHKNLENCVENDCIKTLEDFELGKVPYAKDDGEAYSYY